MILIIVILLIVFILNYTINCIFLLKVNHIINKFKRLYYKTYQIIWAVSIYLIPVINSSFLQLLFPENISYFKQYWIWFMILGIVFLVLGIKIYTLVKNSIKKDEQKVIDFNFITKGVYEITRHPKYTAWLLIFIGLTFIFDSFVALIISPFLIVLIEIEGFLLEKYVLIPKFGIHYENYKKKTPSRIISPPYNYLMIIIAIIVIYIGFLNYSNIA